AHLHDDEPAPSLRRNAYTRDTAPAVTVSAVDSAASAETSDADDDAFDERRREILRVWREHPGFGPSQVRNLIRRRGLRASVTTVRAVMEENGYIAPKHIPKEHTGTYEAARPRELYHLDFNHFHV